MTLEMLGLIIFFVLMVALLIIVLLASLAEDLIKAGKWLGLGAIAANSFNNKVNSDASLKSGQPFRKRNRPTNHKWLDRMIHFISPETDDSELEFMTSETETDYQNYQEFLKWKEAKEKGQDETLSEG